MISIGKFKQFTLVLFLALTVHACGFHLRGSISVTGEMSPVYMLQNNSFELAREIKSLLSSSKIKIVDNADAAKTQLVLVNETKDTRVLSVDGSGQAQEYLLTFTVNITIKVDEAKEIADSIVVRRDLNFDSTAVLGFANEADILYKDMSGYLEIRSNKAYSAVHQFGSPKKNIPSRPFVTVQKKDKKDIGKEIIKHIKGIVL